MYSRYLLLLLIGICLSICYANAQASAENEIVQHEGHRKTRIINGVVSAEDDYRYMVAIMSLEDGVPYLKCGGAIIHRRYVLTAAHCVDSLKSSKIVIRSGGVNGASPNEPHLEPRSYHQIVKIFTPKGYSSLPGRRHQHDIAILKVKQSFDLAYDTRYKKVNLPEYDSDYEDLLATFTGYGVDLIEPKTEEVEKNVTSDERVMGYPDKLRSLSTTIISNEECQEQANVIITEGSICATAKDATAYTSIDDDGGPLVHEGAIVGILNGPRDKFSKGNAEVFTRVSVYIPFIKSVLKHQNTYSVTVR